jgi:hypothetical protein
VLGPPPDGQVHWPHHCRLHLGRWPGNTGREKEQTDGTGSLCPVTVSSS